MLNSNVFLIKVSFLNIISVQVVMLKFFKLNVKGHYFYCIDNEYLKKLSFSLKREY